MIEPAEPTESTEFTESAGPAEPVEPAEIIVVGAGIAGLVLARELVLQGHAVRLLEGESRAGGQVAALQLDGLRIDAGAEAFATRGGIVSQYLEHLGLADRIIAPLQAPAWLHAADGTTVPLPASSMLGIPAAPLADDVVRVVGRPGAWRGVLDAVLPAAVGSTLPTVGALVRRRMGDAILERLVAPVVEGIHSTHPDDLPVSAVPGLVDHLLREKSLGRAVARMRIDAPAGSLVASLEGGMATLADALLAELDRFGVPIEYGVRVAEVHPDHVVLAGAAQAVAGHALAEQPRAEVEVRRGRVAVAAPGLIAPADGVAATRTETHLVTLVLAADIPGGPALATAPRGTGVLVARGSVVAARALTHVTAKWSNIRAAAGGREVVRLSYEQPPSPEQVRRDAQALLGVSIPSDRVLAAHTVTWQRAGRIVVGDDIPVVGEQVAGTGLAAVIAHARAVAEQFGPPQADPPQFGPPQAGVDPRKQLGPIEHHEKETAA